MKLFLEKEQPPKPQSVSRHTRYIKKDFDAERLCIMATVTQDYLQALLYPGWLIVLFLHPVVLMQELIICYNFD